ncbi:MAG: HesA/MoeB/ThiF family protein [Magnetococcales bacterium]|nr:HesA/MoeB/ThiF family protein [Magnetococcales bacterium]
MPHASVLIIGAGGLGSVAAMALAETGIARLTLADPDVVEVSNLHRQPLYLEEDVGQPKVTVAARRLQEIRPGIEIGIVQQKLDRFDELVCLAQDHDCFIDASDNFATRFLANDVALRSGRPLVHGAATGLRGQVMTILPHRTACLRCLFEAPPIRNLPTCREGGIFGPLVMEVGWLAAMEVVKFLENSPDLLTDRMLTIDLTRHIRRHVPLPRQSRCPGCRSNPINTH